MLRFLKNKIAPQSRALQVSKTFSVPLVNFTATGERDAILASSGMGKSYLTGVLMEETLENGGLVCVIDPEGEHFTLAERYPCLIIGGEQAQVPFDPDAVDIYTEAMVSAGLSSIFDLSDYIDSEQQQYYALIADSLFKVEQKYRRKIRVVVEEAQIYAPQSGLGAGAKKKMKGADSITVSQRIAKRGRKRAIDSLWATQRPASLSKDILSQCNRFWFGGITSELDYKAIKPFLSQAGISFDDIKALNPGEFYYYAKGQTEKLRVRKRFCKHAGATPDIGVTFQAATDKGLEAVLGKLGSQIDKRAEEIREEQSEVQRLKDIIKKLEKQNDKLRAELDQERLATKVIQRLDPNQSPTEALSAIENRLQAEGFHDAEGKPKKRGRPKKSIDDGTEAKAASGVTKSKLVQVEKLEL